MRRTLSHMPSDESCRLRPQQEVEAARSERHELSTAMLRVGRGDREAFGLVYDAVAPTVYGIGVRILRNPSLAAELTQDVLLEAWRKAGTYDEARGSVHAWVATLAHRRAVDRVRAETARREREQRVAIEEPEQEDGPEEGLMAQAERARVLHCLKTLTDRERDSVQDAYYGGLSYRQVAERRGLGLPAVKSRIRSALRRLRDCLEVN